MVDAVSPFPLRDVEPEFDALRRHWASLIRGDTDLPSWDDFEPAAVAPLASRLIMLDVFDKPSRFRYGALFGRELEQRYGEDVRDMFVHEASRRAPFDFLESQAEATVESKKPTYYRAGDYSRLLVPMRDGERLAKLLGAVVWR